MKFFQKTSGTYISKSLSKSSKTFFDKSHPQRSGRGSKKIEFLPKPNTTKRSVYYETIRIITSYVGLRFHVGILLL